MRGTHDAKEPEPMSTQAEWPDYTVCAYYFPSYHVDPRNEAIHGPGWTEWD